MQSTDVIVDFMHEKDLCRCPKSANYSTETVPEDGVTECIAISNADELANRLALAGQLK